MRARRRTTALLAAVLLVGAPALAGCATVEGIIEQQTGADIQIGGTTVPVDFPAEVPLLDGDIVNGSALTTGGTRGWNVVVNSSDAAAPDTVTTQFTEAGFLAMPAAGGVDEQGGTLFFGSTSYVITIVFAKIGSGWTVNYTVAGVGG